MRTLDAVFILFCAFKSVSSVPWPVPLPSISPYDQSLQPHTRLHAPSQPRQLKQFSNIVIPDCALSCYLNELVVDGCAQEVDLRCHCSRGDILRKTESCVEAACSKQEQNEATQKVIGACKVVGIYPQLPSAAVSSTLVLSSYSARSSQMTAETMPVATMRSTSSEEPLFVSTTSSSRVTTTARAYPTEETTTLTSPSETASATFTPTEVPIIPPAPDNSLSEGAIAGISVSVLLVASAIFLALSLYIRRLKRQLAQAKAAANVPDSVLRSQSRRSMVPDAMFASTRRQSWPRAPRTRRLSRRDIPYTADSPVSPLSPVFIRESGSGMRASIANVLGKPRGHVLSVVVERDDEDANSLVSRERVTQPVPGQSEGLVDPLELDAGLTVQIFEAPTSITPRARSMEAERDDWKEFDFRGT